MKNADNNIAVIGIALKFPDASDMDMFFENLKNGKDSIGLPPEDRLKYSSVEPKGDFAPAAFIDRMDLFDHKYFNIGRKEAENMDPTQRMVLELSVTAIENAGYAPQAFKGSKTAVYLCSNTTFSMGYLARVTAAATERDPTIHTGALNSMIGGRVAYYLGLTGPSVMIDTGCSSALVALNEAVDKLNNGQVDTALVGGMVLKPGPYASNKAGHLGASSPTGQSRAFSANADGIGNGEGGAILLIKRLEDAIADKDNIHAVIKGVGISQDGGRCNSIAAPSPVAQTEAIKMAWSKAGVDPKTITHVETHGAGTPLGDMIEIQALTDAFGDDSYEKFCALGGVKTNIGHIGNAAGIAGLIKSIISLKKQALFPVLHFDEPNPLIDFENTNVYVNDEFREWTPAGEGPLRCGVSSFGLSGTNTHVVLEEAPKRKTVSEKDQESAGVMVKISAKSTTAFGANKKKVADYLKSLTSPVDDALYTLNSGRGDYALRKAFHADTLEELIERLEAFDEHNEQFVSFPNKQKKLILLVSDGFYSETVFNDLCLRYPLVKKAGDEVLQYLEKTETLSEAVRTFIVHYGILRQLKAFGLNLQLVIGNGIGGYLSGLFSGKATLEETVQKLEAYEHNPNPIDQDKLHQILTRIFQQDEPLLLDIGANNSFYEILKDSKEQFPELRVLGTFDSAQSDPLLERFCACYNEGATVDWNKHYEAGDYAKVEAPTYAFDRIRCWYEPPVEMKVEVEDYLYELSWQKAEDLPEEDPVSSQIFLMIEGEDGLAQKVADKLEQQQNQVIRVRHGESFKKLSNDTYQINLKDQDEYEYLRDVLEMQERQIDGIIHLTSYAQPEEINLENYQSSMNGTFLSVYHTAQAFHELLRNPQFHFAVVTANGEKVNDNDQMLQPAHHVSNKLLKGLIAEFTSLKATSLDFQYGEYADEAIATFLVREMGSDELLRFVAIRGEDRYKPDFAKVDLKQEEAKVPHTFEKGVYLVSGGSSGIGLETCKSIAADGASELIILGRKALPEQGQWEEALNDKETDPSTKEKVAALLEIEKTGAKVTYFQCDVTNPSKLEEVLSVVREKHSKLNGVIHSAGIGNSALDLKDQTLKGTLHTLAPKVTGTLALDELTRPLAPDFFMSFSSVATMVPPRGGLDYLCANAFEDGHTLSQRAQGRKFLTMNWADWKETGLAYRKKLKKSKEEVSRREDRVTGLTNEEGVLAISWGLALNKPHLAVVNADLSFFTVNPYFTMKQHKELPKACALEKQETSETTSLDVIASINQEETTDIEKTLIAIWYDVLKLDAVSIHDDFFELGGHSLNITQMLNRVKKAFGLTLEMDVMLEHNTIKKLADYVEAHSSKDENTKEDQGIRRLPEQEFYELSHAQKRFWILSQKKGKEAYNVPAAFIFTGEVDVKALEKAFVHLIQRHECLRTTFHLVDGTPKQKIHDMDQVAFTLGQEDLTSHEDAEQAAYRRLKEEAAVPFDLSQDLMLRACLFRVADNKYMFFMNMHHIVADATSIVVLKKEVLSFYQQLSVGEVPDMPPLPVQYKDYADWHNKQFAGDKRTEMKKFWKERLQGQPLKLMLPLDHPEAEAEDSTAEKLRLIIGQEKRDALQALADQHKTSLFNTVLALFKVLLFKYTNNSYPVVGTPVSGRDSSELENQIGIYLNTLLLKTHVEDDMSFSELLGQVRDNMLRDLTHQAYPYDLLLEDFEEAGIRESFNVGFTWSMVTHHEEEEHIGFEVERISTGFSMAKNDLWFFGVSMEQCIVIEFLYKTKLFDQSTIELMSLRFESLLNQVLSEPDNALKTIELDKALTERTAAEAEDFEFNF